MNDDSVGELLRERRLELGLTQGEVAAALGLTQGGYSNIERGNVRLGAKHHPAIERILGIKPDVLIAHLLDLANDTERELVRDRLLTKDQRRLLLVIYGEMTRRPSANVATLYGE